MLTAASFRPAIAAALATVGLVALSGCATSFDYATDKPNVLANGGFGTSSDGNLRVNGAVIVADRPADATKAATTGTLIATIALAPQVNGATATQNTLNQLAITNIALDTSSPAYKQGDSVEPAKPPLDLTVNLGDATNPAGSKNLGDPTVGGIAVKGSFTPGEVLPFLITLKNGKTVTLEVPVVKRCGYYANVQSAGQPSVSAAPAPTEAPTVGLYDCGFPDTQDHQGVEPAASAPAASTK